MRCFQRSQRTPSSSNAAVAGGLVTGLVEVLGELGVDVGWAQLAQDLELGIEGIVAIAIQQTEERPSPLLAQVFERAAYVEQWERFEHRMRATGYCCQPVRLRGQVDAIDLRTGESRTVSSTEPEPDRTLLTSCGNRREAVCPSCAKTAAETPTSSWQLACVAEGRA